MSESVEGDAEGPPVTQPPGSSFTLVPEWVPLADRTSGAAESPQSVPIDRFEQKLRMTAVDYDDRLRYLRDADHRLDLHLKRVIGYGAIGAAGAQIVLSNIVFAYYVWWREAELSGQVVVAWYTGVVVEVIGILLVVTRYIFPGRGSSWNDDSNGTGRSAKRCRVRLAERDLALAARRLVGRE